MALLSCYWHVAVLMFLVISCGHSLADVPDEVQQAPLEEQARTVGPGAPPRPPPLVAAAAATAVAGTTKIQIAEAMPAAEATAAAATATSTEAAALPKKQGFVPIRRPPATRQSNRGCSKPLSWISMIPCIAVALKVALLVGGAVWACKLFCPRQPGGFFGVPARWAAPMGLPSRGCYVSVGDSPEERVPPKECTALVSEAPKKARPMLAPLRILGCAVKERLATLTSVSTRASSRGSFRGEDKNLYSLAGQDDDEARSLLWGNRRQPVADSDEEEEEAALTALLKLRPSLADSLGDEADNGSDDDFAGPLVGNGRMGLLNR